MDHHIACQPESSKRSRVSAIDDTTEDAGDHNHQLPKRARHDQLDASSDVLSQAEPQLGFERSLAIPANIYGSSAIGGNANVLMGNAQYHSGPGSQLYGPSMVAGDVKVYTSNIFYGNSQGQPHSMTQEDPSTALKRALYYEAMDNRKAQLDHVDPASFDWVWTKTDFPSWLENDQGIFWISGKPASGKSTLIHHLVNSEVGAERVKLHLARSHESPMLVYFFFDFRAGTGIANIPVGMLRSLLLQLVEKSSDVGQYVLDKCGHRTGGDWPELEAELIDLLCDSLQSQKRYVCGFIDGLDEYKGCLRKLVGTILQLQQRSQMKLCLASRPEPEIQSKLQKASLSMQEHNAGTIRAYTYAAFSELEPFTNQQKLQSLAQNIERDADGVLLWARFAVDEFVCAILQGLPLEDAFIRLNTFPPELEAFYARTLHRLNSAQKLQAAVIFFMVEHWDGSFGECSTSRSLETEDLMMLCSRTLQKLDPAKNFCSDITEERFKLYIHAMLRGLVEFVPQDHGTRPVLVHKCLPTFLHQDTEFMSIADRLGTVLVKRLLGPVFFAETLIMSAKILVPNANNHWSNNDATGLRAALRRLPRRKTWTSVPFSAGVVFRAVVGLIHQDVLDEPEYVAWLVRASQTWIYRSVPLQNAWRTCCLGTSKQEPSTVRNRNPELFDFIIMGHANAFLTIMRSIPGQLSEEERALLFAYVLSGPSFSRYICDDESWPSPLVVWRHHAAGKMLPLLLQRMSQAAHFLMLCISSADTTAFDEILASMGDAGDIANVKIPPSIWWIHQEADIMLCWVGSPFYAHSKTTQQKRLNVLLTSGKDINSPIIDGGNVMDALLKAELWDSNTFLPHLNRTPGEYELDLPHFSMVKFDTIIESGFDLSKRIDCDRYLHSAKRLLEFYSLKSQRMERVNDPYARSAGRKVARLVKDLKEHVIPYLESAAHASG